jgi:molybdopterin synthase sulfur carrier subunit
VKGWSAKNRVAEVWIPRQLQGLTRGQAQVQAAGATVRQVIRSLEDTYPGIIHFLCDDNGIAPNMAVVVDGETSYMGLLEKVQENSEIHFLPAIGGGLARPETSGDIPSS